MSSILYDCKWSFLFEDYVRGLEKECRELRQKNRELEQDADVARRFGRQPVPRPTASEEAVLSEVKDNAMVRSHIQSLNDTIGMLRDFMWAREII